jgi:Tfp pilus assembly protein PilX
MKIIYNKGIATLPTVMILGMMTLAIVISIASLAFNELLISQGSSQSTNALFYAEAGTRDALTRIARDKNYTCASTDCYSLDLITNGCSNNTDCAKVSVSAGVGTTADPKIITSKGIMKSSTRRIQVSVILDSGTSTNSLQNGEITSSTWTELTN